MNSLNLKDRVFACLPAGRYAMAGLLRLLDVVETNEVATAAVECHAQPRLLINPQWVEQHANTPPKLMMLVMHEVHHVLLGHTRRFERLTPADNFIFDCVINALLCRMFPQTDYTALFCDFYREDRFPECLLRPPAGWDPRSYKVAKQAGFEARGLKLAAELHAKLYLGQGVSYQELRDMLKSCLARRPAALAGVVLIGDHRERESGSGTDDSSDDEVQPDQTLQGEAQRVFAAAVGEVVSRWPTPPDPVRGISMAEVLRDMKVRLSRNPSRRRKLRDLIRRVVPATAIGRGAMRRVAAGQMIESPVPTLDRRSVVLRQLGMSPLLYRAELNLQQAMPAQERVHLYLDVSGSMEDVKSALYGAALDCQELLHPKVHLFSDRVADITLAQLRAGYVRSTGGTNINCIARHMERHKVKRAVIVTDGYVGAPGKQEEAVLKGVRLGVAYIGAHCHEADLKPYTLASVDLRDVVAQEVDESEEV